MREVAIRPGQEKVFVKFDPALWLGVDLDHPALDPIGIKLAIDCAVERIGEVDAAPIATHLYHLRSAIKRLTLLRMRGAGDNATDAQFPRKLRLERVGDVVLVKLACAPAGDVKVLVVNGEVDVRHKRWTGFEAFEY